MSGKGSAPRPFDVSNEEYANRWDAIFGKKKPDPHPITWVEMPDTPEPMHAWIQLELTFCKHQVWGHADGSYFCTNCGVKNTGGPYSATSDRSSSAKDVDAP